MHKIFVYGTLKKGQPNHSVLGDSEYLGEACLPANVWTMYNLGAFPCIRWNGGEQSPKISGELYLVDEDTLKALDLLEGHPDFYTRMFVVVDGHGAGLAETYMIRTGKLCPGPVVPSGVW